MVTVSSIIIYPIKGMKGCKQSSGQLEERGFKNDRRYMLIDDMNTFVSQRSHPILSQIAPVVQEDKMIVTYGNQILEFSLDSQSDDRVEAALFEHTVTGRRVSDEADDWFSDILQVPVRLIKMTANDCRYKGLINGPERTEVSYADGYPYLIVGTASLAHLNSELANPVSMDRFRPNIVVDTMVPHEEDDWRAIKIGEIDMQVIKPCARCIVVTIDQESGQKGKEPLVSLSKYRKKENKIYFGANAVSSTLGKIHIGDNLITL